MIRINRNANMELNLPQSNKSGARRNSSIFIDATIAI
jgi:hypothetical protein